MTGEEKPGSAPWWGARSRARSSTTGRKTAEDTIRSVTRCLISGWLGCDLATTLLYFTRGSCRVSGRMVTLFDGSWCVSVQVESSKCPGTAYPSDAGLLRGALIGFPTTQPRRLPEAQSPMPQGLIAPARRRRRPRIREGSDALAVKSERGWRGSNGGSQTRAPCSNGSGGRGSGRSRAAGSVVWEGSALGRPRDWNDGRVGMRGLDGMTTGRGRRWRFAFPLLRGGVWLVLRECCHYRAVHSSAD